jgi:hypothetical protein
MCTIVSRDGQMSDKPKQQFALATVCSVAARGERPLSGVASQLPLAHTDSWVMATLAPIWRRLHKVCCRLV